MPHPPYPCGDLTANSRKTREGWEWRRNLCGRDPPRSEVDLPVMATEARVKVAAVYAKTGDLLLAPVTRFGNILPGLEPGSYSVRAVYPSHLNMQWTDSLPMP